MRLFVVAALALLLGLVIGGLGPRAELRELKEKVAQMEEKDCASPTIGKDLAALLSAGGSRDLRDERDRAREEADRLAAENPELAEQLQDAEDAQAEARGRMSDEVRNAAANAEELKAARAALELRRAQARAALMEDAEPSEAQLTEIDAAVTEMNASLNALANELVERLASGEEPSRRDAMSFAADALDTMIIAEDRITDALDEDQRAAVDEQAIDPFSYIDPKLVDVLEGLGR